MTEDVSARLARRNAGRVSHTEAQAAAFEKCLKSASGRVFAKKRL
jgi:hypothetical protein